MKIITWNCNGKFREKFQYIKECDPDIWCIQECENPSTVNSKIVDYHKFCSNYLWIGDRDSKGIAIFAKESIVLELEKPNLDFRGRTLKWFLLARINYEKRLLCVWNHKNNCGTFDYIGQFWNFMKNNPESMKGLIIAGDFNSNAIWDEWDRWWNHTDCVKELENIGTKSIYHERYNENQGNESNPTFFLQRNKSKKYHIDYIFSPIDKINGTVLEIGNADKWINFSDHLPLIWTNNEST